MRRGVVLAVAVLALAMAASAQAYVRPTDPGTGVYGLPGYSVPEQPPICTDHVCVHYVATTGDAPEDLDDNDRDGIPDSIATLAQQAEIALVRETSANALDWTPPVSDGSRGGGDGLVDLYVLDLQNHASGVTLYDDGQRFDGSPLHGFVEVDRSYTAPSPYRWADDRLIAAHELNHLEQFAYDSYFESWYAEATAQWMVGQVDPQIGRLRVSAEGWAHETALPLVARRSSTSPPANAYDAAVFDAWLAQRHGADVVRDVWAAAAQVPARSSFVPASIDAALAGQGTFYDEYVRFTVANAEWRAPASGFALPGDPPDVERVGSLTPGAAAVNTTLDHTTFALLDVPEHGGQAIDLHVTAPAGLHAAVALVGRAGDATTGTVDTALQELPNGASATVSLADPGRYARVTAVLVNADATTTQSSRDSTGQWSFARDGQSLTTSITETSAPANAAPVNPAPTTVTTSAPSSSPVQPPPVIGDKLFPLSLRVLGASTRRHAVRVRLRLSASARLRVVLRLGRRQVALRAIREPRGTRTVVLVPASAARRPLGAHPRVYTVVVTATRPGARSVTRTLRVRLVL